MTDIQIETERLILRRPDDRDTDAAVAFMQSDRSQFVGGPMTMGFAWRDFAKLVGHWSLRGFGLFTMVEKSSGQSLGITGPYFPADWPEHELGWVMWSTDHEGKGYVYEGAAAARRYAYEVLAWDTAVSYIDPANTRSIGLAKRLGAEEDLTADRPGDTTLVFRHPSPTALGLGGGAA